METIIYPLLVFILLHLVAYVRPYVLVKKWQHCNANANYDHIYNLTFTTIGVTQYVDGLLLYKVPLDNTQRSHVSVDILTGNTFIHLLDINERKSCDAFHKYFGEFAYEWERHLQIIPGKCPVPTGKYYLHNFNIDFKKITTLVNFPFGYLRFRDSVYNNKNKLLTCLEFELQNQL